MIVRYKEDFEELGKLTRFEIARDNESQRNETEFYLNEEQFYLLVTYMKNTPIARKYKIDFVKQFSFMRKELIARSEIRHIGKVYRKSLTDVIKNNLDEGNFKSFAYGNYTKLIYKKLFGKTVKQLKEERNCKENGNIRDYFTVEEIERIQSAESVIASIIQYDNTNDDKIVYQKIKEYSSSESNSAVTDCHHRII